MTDSEIIKYQKRAVYVAKKYGYPQLADDFAQEIIIEFLQNPDRGATVDQLFVDYLRKQYGRTGTPGGDAKSYAIHTMGDLDSARHVAHDPGEQLKTRRTDYFIRGKDYEFYSLYFINEFTKKEIGKIKRITESGVSQRLKPIKKKMQASAILEEGYERLEWDESFLKFNIDWLSL